MLLDFYQVISAETWSPVLQFSGINRISDERRFEVVQLLIKMIIYKTETLNTCDL